MATKQIAWNTGSGNITLTYQGQGDGPISVQSDANNGNARSQTITIQTTKGGLITKNVTVSQAACPIPVGDVKNFSYTGNVQSVLLPAGTYKLQCWGAQGGSNAAASSYGITAKAGGKGGYSEGVLTLSSPTTVYIFVGGKGGSSGNGGWNGGGGGTGSSNASYTNMSGTSRFGCGGGATDIALVTSSMSYSSYRNNRSSASLLSRIIVAGGGSGGAMTYREDITTSTTWNTEHTYSGTDMILNSGWYAIWDAKSDITNTNSYFKVTITGTYSDDEIDIIKTDSSVGRYNSGDSFYVDFSTLSAFRIWVNCTSANLSTISIKIEREVETTITTPSTYSQVGYAGGGETSLGGSYLSWDAKATQTSAGEFGSFGFGACQKNSNFIHNAGCGGGGWYGGGGGDYSNIYTQSTSISGGGSGFVNTAASAGNRPSGYTGLQLDSGETKAGNTSFPAPSGGNEIGHPGNGYARITRLN